MPYLLDLAPQTTTSTSNTTSFLRLNEGHHFDHDNFDEVIATVDHFQDTDDYKEGISMLNKDHLTVCKCRREQC